MIHDIIDLLERKGEKINESLDEMSEILGQSIRDELVKNIDIKRKSLQIKYNKKKIRLV